MDNFKHFLLENTDWQTIFIGLLEELKQLLIASPYNYTWNATEDDIERVLKGTYMNSSYSVWASRLFDFRNNSVASNILFYPNQLSLSVQLPLADIYRAKRDKMYGVFDVCKSTHQLFYECARVTNVPYVMPFDRHELDMFKERLEEKRPQYEIINKMEQIHKSGQYDQILDLMIEAGIPKYKVLQYKVKFGIPVDPKEIDDETLVGML